MLQVFLAYLVGLGPYLALALLLGIGIPLVLLFSKPSRWLVPTLVLFTCLIALGGGGSAVAGAEGSMSRQITWGGTFLVSLFFCLNFKQKGARFPVELVPASYFLLIFFSIVSFAWAFNPAVSLKRSIQLVGVLLIAMALVNQKRGENVVTQFASPAFFLLLLGVVALAAPSISLDTDGNYRGFTFTKNVWGQFALFSSIVFLFSAIEKKGFNKWWGAFLFSSASLFATRSATSIVIYFGVIGISFFMYLYDKYRGRMYISAYAAISIFSVCVFSYFLIEGSLHSDRLVNAGFRSVGKDVTLTGRTELWEMMFREIARHPWLGTGYGSFWLGLDGLSREIFLVFSWRPGQAHNGYIDIINEIGLVGFFVFLFVIFVHVKKIYELFCSGQKNFVVMHFGILISALLLNVSESSALRTTHLWWIVLSISIFDVHSRLRGGALKASCVTDAVDKEVVS